MASKIRKSRLGLRELAISNQPWSDDLARRYVDQKCESVSITALDKGFAIADIAFLRGLPGLREVRLLGNVQDDTAVSDLTALECLWVDTPCTKTADLSGLKRLRQLLIAWPHDLSGVSALRNLEDLEVFAFSGHTLDWLGPKPELRSLRIDSRKTHTFQLSGIEQAPDLTQLRFYGGTISDAALLSSLPRLRGVEFRDTRIPSIEFARTLTELLELKLENSGSIPTLEPLTSHPELRSLELSGSTLVEDGDLSPLLSIPQLVTASIEKQQRLYGPIAREIGDRYPPIVGRAHWKDSIA